MTSPLTEPTIPLIDSNDNWPVIETASDPVDSKAIEILSSYAESRDEFWRFKDLIKSKTIQPLVHQLSQEAYRTQKKCQKILEAIFSAKQLEFDSPSSFSIDSLLLLKEVMEALDLRNSEIPLNPKMLSILEHPSNNPIQEETRLSILTILKKNNYVIIAVEDKEFCYSMDNLLIKTNFFQRMLSVGTNEVEKESIKYSGIPRITLSTVENFGIKEKHWILILNYLNGQRVDISEMVEEIGITNCQGFFDSLGLNDNAQDILKANSRIYKSILNSYDNMQDFRVNWMKYRTFFLSAFTPVVVFSLQEAQAQVNFDYPEDLIEFDDFVKRIQNQYQIKITSETNTKTIFFNHQAEESTIRALGRFQKIKHMTFSKIPSFSLLTKLHEWKIGRLFSFYLEDLTEDQATCLKSSRIAIDDLTIEHLSQPESLSLLSPVNMLTLLEVNVANDQELRLEAKQSVEFRSSSIKKLHIIADFAARVYKCLSLKELIIESRHTIVLDNPSLKSIEAPKATYIHVNHYKNLNKITHPETATFVYKS